MPAPSPRDFDRSIARVKHVLTSRYGEQQAQTLMRESRQAYEPLIPQIPFIGDKNPLLIFLLPASRYLAVYQALQKQGRGVEEAGQLVYEMSKADYLKAKADVLRNLRNKFAEAGQSEAKEKAEKLLEELKEEVRRET